MCKITFAPIILAILSLTQSVILVCQSLTSSIEICAVYFLQICLPCENDEHYGFYSTGNRCSTAIIMIILMRSGVTSITGFFPLCNIFLFFSAELLTPASIMFVFFTRRLCAHSWSSDNGTEF